MPPKGQKAKDSVSRVPPKNRPIRSGDGDGDGDGGPKTLPEGSQYLPIDRDETPMASNNSSAFDGLSQTSSTCSRASSTRLRADLEYTWPSINFLDNSDALNADELLLVKRVREASRKLPFQFKVDLDSDPGSELKLDGIQWEKDSVRFFDSCILRTLDEARKIKEAASLCSQESHDEESWSDNVVLPLLKLSIELAGLEKNVMLANLKTVSVDDKSLLPRKRADEVSHKQVDYGLALLNNTEEDRRVLNMLQDSDDPHISVNPSDIQMLRRRALFSNIEMKKTGSNSDPVPQLAIWCCASFVKLERLCREGQVLLESIPSRPCWIIEGHQWRLHMLRRQGHDTITMIGTPLTFNTTSVAEVLYIANALGRIHRWGDCEYRRWFMRLIDSVNRARSSDVSSTEV